MNLAQKVCIGVTLLVVAMFLLSGGDGDYVYTPRFKPGEGVNYVQEHVTDPGKTVMESFGILLAGAAVTWFLGIRRKRQGKPGQSDAQD